jgi:putative salt-induced outer membrane protein YdiY
MKKILLIGILTTQYLFALVSISPVELGKKPGLSGSFEAGLETKRGNTDKDNYKASVKINYDNNESYVIWGEFSGEYGESNYAKDTNKAFSHLRYIHSLTNDENLRYELFAQLESDEFRQINSRTLGGAGLRYRVFNSPKNGKGFLGLGGFYENIEYKNPLIDPSEDNARINSYLAYSIDYTELSTFSYVVYYQPKVDDYDDYIFSNQLELKINIIKTLFLKINVSWNEDSAPPVGVEKNDFTQTTTFVFDF